MQNNIVHSYKGIDAEEEGGGGGGVLDWHPCSPDLATIENMWSILKCKMR